MIKMPKSCEDLWRIGHLKSGLYSVVGNKTVKTVFCDFQKIPDEASMHYIFQKKAFTFKPI